MKNTNKIRGFTLIELLVMVAIISIVASAATPISEHLSKQAEPPAAKATQASEQDQARRLFTKEYMQLTSAIAAPIPANHRTQQ